MKALRSIIEYVVVGVIINVVFFLVCSLVLSFAKYEIIFDAAQWSEVGRWMFAWFSVLFWALLAGAFIAGDETTSEPPFIG